MRSILKTVLLSKLFVLFLIAGCSQSSVPSGDDPVIPIPDPNTPFEAVGTTSTLDLATWNLEWFGDTDRGPSNESLQVRNVAFVISGLDMDIWSVQEVTDATQFNTLLDSLSGYNGFLANDESVTLGPEYYSDYFDEEQKVGLIYKSDLVTINAAQVILTDYDYEFAGRPPVEIQMSVSLNNTTTELVVILLHAKAQTDGSESYQRRIAGSEALKTYLDSARVDANVAVIGDFNDDLDESIYNSLDSSYLNFIQDSTQYVFPTLSLSEAGASSTVFYPDIIDHHLNSNEWYANFEANSAQVFQADEYVVDYSGTTSDHYPVLTRYSLSAN